MPCVCASRAYVLLSCTSRLRCCRPNCGILCCGCGGGCLLFYSLHGNCAMSFVTDSSTAATLLPCPARADPRQVWTDLSKRCSSPPPTPLPAVSSSTPISRCVGGSSTAVALLRWLTTLGCRVRGAQNVGRLQYMSQITTDRMFDLPTATSTLVLPVDQREMDLSYPAFGRGPTFFNNSSKQKSGRGRICMKNQPF